MFNVNHVNGSDKWLQQRYETDVAEKILSRHLQEVLKQTSL